ncbi:MAG: pilus assembly protein TadG-related protein [Actinomycetes bacterium]
MSPFLALLIAFALLVSLGLSQLGSMVLDRVHARTAADAAALAGVTGGRTAADRFAQANNGRVEQFVDRGGETEVTVRVGRARATARARRGPPSQVRPMSDAVDHR